MGNKTNITNSGEKRNRGGGVIQFSEKVKRGDMVLGPIYGPYSVLKNSQKIKDLVVIFPLQKMLT
jgi:hypothetical protein